MTIQIQRILLPADFSDYSTAATKYACELAARFNSELHVMLGSVAESMVRTAPCSVLTVRPEGHQFVMP